MELTVIVSDSEAPRAYPYRKVVFLADRVEVAVLPCEGPASENIVFHEDLLRRLLQRHPELDGAAFTPGWLMQEDDEAVLYLAAGGEELRHEEGKRFGEALRGWCGERGIRRLRIADASRSAGGDGAAEDDWALPS